MTLVDKYIVELYDSSGTKIAELMNIWENISVTVTRNRADTIVMTFDLNTIEEFARDLKTSVQNLFLVNVNEIKVNRAGNYIAAGQINSLTAAKGTDSGSLEVRASGWLSLFMKRYTDDSKIIVADDIGAAMWDVINDAQTGTNKDFGITQGTIQTSFDIDREWEYKNVAEILVEESETSLTTGSNTQFGPDFEFTHDKIFNVYYPHMGRSNHITFEFSRNMFNIAVETDGTQMVNSAIMRGQGYGTEQLTTTRSDSNSQATYKVREEVIDVPDAKETARLEGAGDAELQIRAIPLFIPSFSLVPNLDGTQPEVKKDFWIDDEFKINVDSDYFRDVASNVYRIESLNIQVDEDGLETVSVNQGEKTVQANPEASERLQLIKKIGHLRNILGQFNGDYFNITETDYDDEITTTRYDTRTASIDTLKGLAGRFGAQVNKRRRRGSRIARPSVSSGRRGGLAGSIPRNRIPRGPRTIRSGTKKDL